MNVHANSFMRGCKDAERRVKNERVGEGERELKYE